MISFLPLIEREIRLVVKRPRTYYARMWAALVVSAITLTILYAGFGGGLSAGSAGATLFVVISGLGYLYVLLDGVFLTADCLSHEKREGTLGLLFLTGLRGYDVVLGKLVSRSANSACCVVAALPALGLTLFLGGIAGADFVKMVLALLNCLFFSVSFGLLVSAICRDERFSLNGAVAGGLMLGIVLPALGCWLKHFGKLPFVELLFVAPTPGGAFAAALSPVVRSLPAIPFASSLLTSHLVGWAFLALASAILPHDWSEKASRRSMRAWLKISLLGQGNAHAPRSRGLASDSRLDANPMIWLGQRYGKNGILLTLAALAAIWISGWILIPRIWLSLQVYAATPLVLHLVLMYSASLEACRGAINDRKTGVLELLLTTPLGDDLLLRGRLLALKRRLLWPVMLVIAADIACMVAGWLRFPYPSVEAMIWTALFLFFIAKLFADLFALTWVGVWQGFKAGSTYLAVRRTFSYVFLARWALFIGTLGGLAFLTQGQLFQSSQVGLLGSITVLLYVTFFAATTLHYCGAAMNELKDDLRVLAVMLDEREAQALWRPSGSKLEHWPKLIASFACSRKMQLAARNKKGI